MFVDLFAIDRVIGPQFKFQPELSTTISTDTLFPYFPLFCFFSSFGPLRRFQVVWVQVKWKRFDQQHIEQIEGPHDKICKRHKLVRKTEAVLKVLGEKNRHVPVAQRQQAIGVVSDGCEKSYSSGPFQFDHQRLHQHLRHDQVKMRACSHDMILVALKDQEPRQGDGDDCHKFGICRDPTLGKKRLYSLLLLVNFGVEEPREAEPEDDKHKVLRLDGRKDIVQREHAPHVNGDQQPLGSSSGSLD